MNETTNLSDHDPNDDAGTYPLMGEAAADLPPPAFVDRVKEAYLLILKSGKAPSQRVVRDAMLANGGGSPNWIKATLHAYRDSWIAEAKSIPGEIEIDVIVAARRLSPDLVAALEKQFAKRDAKEIQRLNVLNDSYRTELDRVEETNDLLRETVAAQNSLLAQNSQQLGECTAALKEMRQQMVDQRQEMSKRMESLTQQVLAKFDDVGKETSDMRAILESCDTGLNAISGQMEATATKDDLSNVSQLAQETAVRLGSLGDAWNSRFQTTEVRVLHNRVDRKLLMQMDRKLAAIAKDAK